ncbi:MAG: class I SAM-dependent methyltransferase [Candidatus Omnitrophota bacterium]
MQNKFSAICPVCESNNWDRIYRINEWDINECKTCHFAIIDPLPVRERRGEYYCEEKVIVRNIKKKTLSKKISGALKKFFSKAAKRNKSKIFFDKFCKYLAPGAKVLDVGCGDGSFLRLAKSKFVGSGIEISTYLAGLAGKDSDLKIFSGDFLTTDTNEIYDGICMISLLEHLDSPQRALKKCFDNLNKGGVLLLKTVNYSCLNRKIKRGGWTGFRPPDHIVYFTPKNLTRMLRKVGFRKIRISSWPFNDNMYCDAFK